MSLGTEQSYSYGNGSPGNADPEYDHSFISPASGAESLFLAGLAASSLSARVLSEQIRMNHRSAGSPGVSFMSNSVYSVATDDFVSAVECTDDLSDYQEYNIFGKDVLGRTTSIPEIESEDSFGDDNEEEVLREVEIMSKTSTYAQATTLPPKTKMAPEFGLAPAGKIEFDAAEKVYEGAKGVWAWGKGVMVVKPFLGLAEGIANKVAGVVGTDLEEIDGNIKPQLDKLDHGILNPAIDAIVGIVLGVVGKSGEILKPIIEKIFIPFGLIKAEAETPELTASKTSSK